MYTHHKFDHEFKGDINPIVSYMVCSIPRSGSSLLCELLCTTGRAGAPTEFFDATLMKEFSTTWQVESFEQYLDALLHKKTSPNGVFGVKVHYGQFIDAFGDADVTRLFPNLRFIYIRRQDHVRQAVSYARAEQTGQWAADHPSRSESPVFNRHQIEEYLHLIEHHEEMWGRLFERNGISPFTVLYEDFIATPQHTVIELMKFLYIPTAGVAISAPTLERQADELSEEWVSLYAGG